MTGKHLRDLYEAQPFKPFSMILADGRSVPVVHPEWMTISPTGRIVTVFEPDDSLRIIDLILVTALEVGKPLQRKTPLRRRPRK